MIIRKAITADTDTGEILHQTETEMNFYLFSPQGYLLHNNRSSVKVIELPLASMSADEKGKLLSMLPLIDERNRFMRSDRRGIPINTKHLSLYLGLSSPRTYALLKRLKELAIIRIHDDTMYANPVYLLASSRLHPEVYQVFRKECDAVLPEWVRAKYMEG